MRKPGVSVVIPTHNRAPFLRRAIRSALNQDYGVSEVIVVDDASADETSEVVKAFGEAIRVIRTDVNVERGAARNLGARAATAELLAFLDADDEWMPGKLSRQAPLATNCGACVTGLEIVRSDGRVIAKTALPQHVALSDVIAGNPFVGCPSSLVVSKAVFNEIGGFVERDLQGSEDWLFVVDLVRRGIEIAMVREPYARYLVHAGQSVARPDGVARSMWAAADWLENSGIATGRAAARMRARTACTIARGFAWHGRWRQAAVWGVRSLRSGGAREAVRALATIPTSAAAGSLRRRGLR